MHTSASSCSPSESGSSSSMGDWATPRRFGATLGGPPRRSPAMTSDALRTKRCARCDTAWATPVVTAPRRRAGAAALAAPEDGRALVARAACTELAARRSAAAAPGSWRLDVGPLSLCSSWSGWSGDPPAPAASRERLGAACPRPGQAPALPPPPKGQRRGRRRPSSAPFMASREPCVCVSRA